MSERALAGLAGSYSPTNPGLSVVGGSFNTQWDTVYRWGYNADEARAGEPLSVFVVEQNFENAPGSFHLETYLETAPNPAGQRVRPFGFVLDRTTGSVGTQVNYAGGAFDLAGGAAGVTQQWHVTDGSFEFTPNVYSLAGTGQLTVASGPGGSGALFLQSATNMAIEAGAGAHGHTLSVLADTYALNDGAGALLANVDTQVSGFRLYPQGDEVGSLGLFNARWGALFAATVHAGAGNAAITSSATANPNGSVVGSPGDLFLSTNGGAGTTLWVKESGAGTNTGWVGK